MGAKVSAGDVSKKAEQEVQLTLNKNLSTPTLSMEEVLNQCLTKKDKQDKTPMS